MTEAELSELEKLCGEATPLPWYFEYTHGEIIIADDKNLDWIARLYDEGGENNPKFIVAAVNAIPTLIKEIKDLRKQLECAEEVIRIHAANCSPSAIKYLEGKGINLDQTHSK